MDYFTNQSLQYLAQLRKNNSHEWFRAHKEKYERLVREPALKLIASLEPALKEASLHFIASPKKVGGSLFRVMKDTRFEHAEGPYKPWIGMRFYHERAREVHSPGYYVHLEKGNSYMGGGVWRPDSKDLRKIRDFIISNPQAWLNARKNVSEKYNMGGEILTRPPRGYDTSNLTDPLIEKDLLWKDFIWEVALPDDIVTHGAALQQRLENNFKDLAPAIDYLCAALDLDF